jgi:hypothetical protein
MQQSIGLFHTPFYYNFKQNRPASAAQVTCHNTTESAGRVQRRVCGREIFPLGYPQHMQSDGEDKRHHQQPAAEPAHGVQRLRCDGKERHGIVIDNGQEQLAVSPHQIGQNPQELHDVVHMVDQPALGASCEQWTRTTKVGRVTHGP